MSSEDLLDAARAAARNAHAPYSRFPVGAALRDASGRVFVGCNVESASYGLSLCAERVAIFGAIAAGASKPFQAIAVTCPTAHATLGPAGRMPCGACRQVIAEHLPQAAEVLVDGVGAYSVADLLPEAFKLG
jgi:cytidine deaminase